jgi:hypothetical protein
VTVQASLRLLGLLMAEALSADIGKSPRRSPLETEDALGWARTVRRDYSHWPPGFSWKCSSVTSWST